MSGEIKNAYKHKPLTRESNRTTKPIPIRLLVLHAKLAEDTLIGHIIERPEGQEYEALSYCWSTKSDSGEPHYINIWDDPGYGTLEIRPNLAAALKCLRNKDKSRYLWIDSICIDQTNNKEKSEQIPLMDLIYKEAQRVCIWLGEATGGNQDEVALAHIRDIIKLQGFEDLIDPKFTNQWAALASLMKREWFSRRWVVQEIAYARAAKVYWGSQSIDWKDLADAVALFGSKASEIAELFRQDRQYNHRADFLGDVEALSANRLVQTIGKVFRKADNGQRIERLLSLESLISNLSAFNASRPHDIIYAVLSLAKDTITSAVPPIQIRTPAVPPTEIRTKSTRRLSDGGNPRRLSNADQSADLLALMNMDDRTDGQGPRPGSPDPPLSPIPESSNATIFDVMSAEKAEAVRQMEELGFAADAIQNARDKIELYRSCMPPVFNYKTMIENCEAQFGKEATTIGKRFWDDEAQSWLRQGDKGLHCLTLKLLRHEKALQALAEKAFVSLRGRVQVKTFHVDYKKKFYEVCKDLINFTIRSSKSLDMLCRPWAPDKEDLPEADKEATDLPSWICPLSRSPYLPRPDGNFGRVNADLLIGMPGSGGSPYTASANTIPEQWFFGGEGQRKLFVTGLVIDEIQETATEAIEGNIPSAWLKFGGWTDSKDAPPESFWRTIVADRNEHGQNPPSYYQRACQYAFGQRTTRGSLNTDRLINSKISQVMTDYLKRVQAVVWMRKLIRTKYGESDSDSRQSPDILVNGVQTNEATKHHNPGRLGLAPHTALIGDKICMLRGCSVPVILREVKPDQAAKDKATVDQKKKLKDQGTGIGWEEMVCTLVGECYVHGIMDGEAFKIRAQRDLPDHIFEIQ